MPENFSARDLAPPAPTGGATSEHRSNQPNYPPPGHAQRQARLRAKEARISAAETGDLDATTDAALNAAETPTEAERLPVITQWVTEFLPDLQPLELAAEACWKIEKEEWEFDADYRVTDEAPSDIRPGVRDYIVIHKREASKAENAEIITATEGSLAKKRAEVEIGDEAIANRRAAVDAANAEAARKLRIDPATRVTDIQGLESEIDADIANNEAATEAEKTTTAVEKTDKQIIKANYPGPLKSEYGGSIGALQALEGMVQSPATKEHIRAVLAKVAALQQAIPGKRALITRLLNVSHINLDGAGPAAFADFMSTADASVELTDDEKTTLREVLHGATDIKTGSDVKAAFAQGRGYTAGLDGEPQVIEYDEDHPLNWGTGISVYPDGDLIRGTAEFDGQKFPFVAPASLSGSALTERLNYSVFNAVNEAAGVTGGSNQGFEVTQGFKAMDLGDGLFEGQAIREAKLGLENMVDRFDAGGSLLDRETIQQIAWGHQWLMPQRDFAGDSGFGDKDEAARAAALGGRGIDGLIWSADDRLNEASYVIACRYIRERARAGRSEPDYDALIDHIESANATGQGGDVKLAA